MLTLVASALLVIVLLLLGVILSRKLWMWLFGVDEILVELRALRAELHQRNQPAPVAQPTPQPAPVTSAPMPEHAWYFGKH